MTQLISPPDRIWPPDGSRAYRPSWSGVDGYLNEEHAAIWDTTRDIPGRQEPEDSAKLYEMAYHCGGIILEIGTYRGRSAIVELRGALQARQDKGGPLPQYYGIDLDAEVLSLAQNSHPVDLNEGAIHRTYHSLRAADLDGYALLYHGDLRGFHRDVPITPTMVFVDGDHRYAGVTADLETLTTFLAPGTPVLCHDFHGVEGVTRAVEEWGRSGYYDLIGFFGCSALLRTTDWCRGQPWGLQPETFQQLRKALLSRYLVSEGGGLRTDGPTPVRDLTVPARTEFRQQHTLLITPPDLTYPQDGGHEYRPSWSGVNGYLNEEHATIWQQTKDLPGWQDTNDSTKLYEMAYHAGAVILEIGLFGGRSAVVQLRGAVRAAREKDTPPPQFYGLDVDPRAMHWSYHTLRGANLDRHALLYHGDLRDFHRDVPITPTMVFVDGDHSYAGIWADLNTLSTFLAPGTPVLCHDYVGVDGVSRAVNEWSQSGYFDLIGCFGCAGLLRATKRCSGKAVGLRPETFERLHNALLARYLGGEEGLRSERYTPVHDLTALARADFPLTNPGPHSRLTWPHAAPDGLPLPPTLPDGRPWPKISIVTPSYNQGRFIEETILSVANQDYPNVEHIVMDGGSTDETLEVLERHRHRLAHVLSEKDRGQSHAINKGFALASGEIFTWLNSDDQLLPGSLAAMALAFHTSGADMVAGVCQLHRDSIVEGQHLTSCTNGPLPLDDLLDLDHCWNVGQFFYQPEVFFTRVLWEKAGGHLDESQYYSMDYELWLRFAEAGARLHVIGRPIAFFRMHPEQKTAIPERFQKELVTVRDAFLERTGRRWSPRMPAKVKQRLRVAFVNDVGFEYGAGIAHERLAQALANGGHEVFAVALGAGGAARGASGGDVLRALAERNPDLVIVGNLHSSSTDAGLTGQIANRWPTTVVLHDFWPLTGRCPYPGSCTRYVEGCDHTCPTADEYPALAPGKIAEAFRIKHRVFDLPRPPALLAVSRWGQETALKLLHRTHEVPPGGTHGARVGRISLGLDQTIFRPRDQRTCRELLGLPERAFIVMAGACSIKDTRKGMQHLNEALAQLDLPDLLLLLVGQASPEDCPPLPNVRSLGFVKDPHKLALAYGAADVFVGPSLAETFGQVFMEAAACGTPSLGYPAGGVCDAICDGVTGRLAARLEPTALAGALEELYCRPQWRRHLGQWARLYAENEWSYATVYHRFSCALSELGMRDAVGMGRKIGLTAQPVELEGCGWLEAPGDRWMPISGFGKWEGPFPEWGLPVCIWCQGPQSTFEVTAENDGPHVVLLRCLNWEKNQQLRVWHEGAEVCEQSVPVVGSNADVLTLRLPVNLKAGKNRIELLPWRWSSKSPSDLRRALLILGIHRYPTTAAPAAA